MSLKKTMAAYFKTRHMPFRLLRLNHFLSMQIVIAAMTNILSLALPILMLQVYDRIIPHQSYGTLIILCAGVGVALVFDSILRTMRAWLAGRVTALQEQQVSCQAVEHLCRADLPDFQRVSTGEHLQNMTALSRLREFYSGQALTALIDLPFVGIFLALIAYLGHGLVIMPLTLLGLFLVVAISSGNQLKIALERRTIQDNRKASFLVTVLTGIHTVKAMAMETFCLRGFEQRQNPMTRENYRVALANGETNILAVFFGQLSIIATATAGTILVLNNHLSVGGLSACTLLAGRAIQPIQRILGTWLRLQDIAIARQQTQSLFDLPTQTRTVAAMPPLEGQITLEDITFQTHAHDTPLLDHISLAIQAGEIVAFSGDQGSGKSTLLQIVAGLLHPTMGSVRLDHCHPSLYQPTELVKQIAYLPQRATIFKGSLIDNITGFRTDTASIAAAKQVGQQLGLDVIVNNLPRGYQTLLTDSPADPVPPGVKQRIALARALLYPPSILLFDDADRALDKDGYNLLFRLIGRLKGQTTILLVSQDQNLLSFADRSYHLERGHLIEQEIKPSQHLVFLTQKTKGRPHDTLFLHVFNCAVAGRLAMAGQCPATCRSHQHDRIKQRAVIITITRHHGKFRLCQPGAAHKRERPAHAFAADDLCA